MEKDFTEYSDDELDNWFKEYIKGWSGDAVGPTKNFEVVLAEMQRRNAKIQNKSTEKIVSLTDKLVDLTVKLNFLNYVLIILAAVSLLILIFK